MYQTLYHDTSSLFFCYSMPFQRFTKFEKFAGNDLEPFFLKHVVIGMTMASMCMMMELYTT
jgi:regulatory protein YycH of two-component signal transduction system YycFG